MADMVERRDALYLIAGTLSMETMVSRNSRSASCEVESSEIIALRETGADSDADFCLTACPPSIQSSLSSCTALRSGAAASKSATGPHGSSKFGVRIQRRPGSQHKCALPSTRMGQCQIRIRAGDASKSIMSKSNGLESQ